jgi:hypothetical protein
MQLLPEPASRAPMRRVAPAALLLTTAWLFACGGPAPKPPEPQQSPPAPQTPSPAPAPVDPQLAEENQPPAPDSRAVAPAAPAPSDATGCAPGTRCLRVTQAGRPQASGTSIAQCRGKFPDFIVPSNTLPAGYAGPWFKPELVEEAHTGIPQGARPWTSVDPRDESQRLAYLLTLRNYAFASAVVRGLTPTLTADSDYLDPTGATVPANQRTQKWYPAPRMTYGRPSDPGTREAAHGMTRERRVIVGELGGNTAAFLNYAVAYHDARGARTYARVWSTAAPGVDTPDTSRTRFTEGALVFKLIFSAARPSDFPTDLLAGSLALSILPNASAAPVTVRLLQIDIAAKDNRAGPTGWYFATFAFDRAVAGSSPWLKMAPVGLMWGNDPAGTPINESWINASAPAYARAHLGVGGRLNGPIDNRASACLSCHSTAQAPSLANILPPSGNNTCTPLRANWFRNLPGTQPFGRFDPRPTTCETSLSGITLTAADYSLQLAETVANALPSAPSRFNPCTWDTANPPSAVPAAGLERTAAPGTPTVFPVTRDPKP